MSRYEAFCNTNTDLSMILPEIDSFDRKRLIQNFVQHSGSVYVAHDAGYTQLKMPSTEVRRIPSDAWASIGEVSNDEHRLVNIGKAGRARHMGLRPKTRGAARNAVDHPHGGGEGKSPRGHRRQRTKQGRPTGKGQKTRSPKKYSNKLIVSRRKVGKRR